MNSVSKNARVAGLLYILASVVGVVRLIYIAKRSRAREPCSVTCRPVRRYRDMICLLKTPSSDFHRNVTLLQSGSRGFWLLKTLFALKTQSFHAS
jgi:hypothetical protein